MNSLTFKPQSITEKLISYLPERAQDILRKRFGLGESEESMTLEAIGKIYGITRERVRQIENHSLNKIKESEIIAEYENAFRELADLIHNLGVIVHEDELLGQLSGNKKDQNHLYLLLTIGDLFNLEKENKVLKHRWHVDDVIAEAVHDALEKLHKDLGDEDLVTEKEIVDRFKKHIDTSRVSDKHLANEDIIKRWLNISKKIDRNPLGEWGLSSSPNIRVKGVRDYAYLVIRKHGSPMHFTEVTKKIRELFGKDAHVATTHNELIKDSRFVLVGRGLYALEEWGYMKGIVRDVIENVLKKHGPLTREQIIEKVLKERYVKPNTVVVNLQNSDVFVRQNDDTYALAA